jgi:5-methylcytosine-specific restriction endonuclease McrA
MVYKDPDYHLNYRKKNSAKYRKEREERKQHAIDSIKNGQIIDRTKWDMWCNRIKIGAKQYNHPYSTEFTNDVIFEMMLKGCFYCADIATTIDRIDSTLDHTPENCVGCCEGCNYSKGTSDSYTFVRKAYYRVRKEYIDDIKNIWFVCKQKPSMWNYNRSSKSKEVPFELTKEDWNTLIKNDCEYCKRSPITWFGVDRVVPSKGYVIGNVVTCCFDCNLDKHKASVEETAKRNERITNRLDSGDLVINVCPKTIIHQGINKTANKVCAYGKVYESKADASRALGKNDGYVCKCIRDGRHSDDIFEITDDFKF